MSSTRLQGCGYVGVTGTLREKSRLRVNAQYKGMTRLRDRYRNVYDRYYQEEMEASGGNSSRSAWRTLGRLRDKYYNVYYRYYNDAREELGLHRVDEVESQVDGQVDEEEESADVAV